MKFVPYILLTAGLGMVAGFAAQRVLPGRTTVSILAAVPTSVCAAVLGGLVSWYGFQSTVAGFVIGVLLALGLFYLLRNPRQPSAG